MGVSVVGPTPATNLPTVVIGDGTVGGTALQTFSATAAYDGVINTEIRTPRTFKTGVASAAGSTAIWTPAAGKKFRLMGYSIEISGNASLAVAGLLEVTLLDAAAAIGQGVSLWLSNAAGTLLGNVQLSGGMRQLGNGLISAAANNPLNVNLSVALATGEIRVNAIGTEE